MAGGREGSKNASVWGQRRPKAKLILDAVYANKALVRLGKPHAVTLSLSYKRSHLLGWGRSTHSRLWVGRRPSSAAASSQERSFIHQA